VSSYACCKDSAARQTDSTVAGNRHCGWRLRLRLQLRLRLRHSRRPVSKARGVASTDQSRAVRTWLICRPAALPPCRPSGTSLYSPPFVGRMRIDSCSCSTGLLHGAATRTLALVKRREAPFRMRGIVVNPQAPSPLSSRFSTAEPSSRRCNPTPRADTTAASTFFRLCRC
jgi:hypothetical protein